MGTEDTRTIVFYEHGKCPCGEIEADVGCKVVVTPAKISAEGAEWIEEFLKEARNG